MRLRDFVVNTVRKLSPSLIFYPSSPIHSSGTPYTSAHFVNYDRFLLDIEIFLQLNLQVLTSFFKEAMKDTRSLEAMQKEIQTLEDNGTWSVETLPHGKRASGSRWVNKVKYNSDGSIERLKSRLVVFGNRQVAGIYYIDTFAAVAKMIIIVRVFLVIAAAENWELH